MSAATANRDGLKVAIAAAQAGRTIEARNIALSALAAGDEPVSLNAFIGMLEARAGHADAAILYLKRAFDARPTDAIIASNLIAAFISAGRLSEAFDIAGWDAAVADRSLRIARYRGFLAQSLDRFDEAVRAYRHVLASAPNDFESWNNLGNALSATGAADEAVTALEKAVALNPATPQTRLNLADALVNSGLSVDAETVILEATAAFPADAMVWQTLYRLLSAKGSAHEALAALRRAVACDPIAPGLQLELAIQCGIAMDTEGAEIAYRRAIALDPSLAAAYLGLAIQYEHSNREHELPALISLAEANGIASDALAFLRALDHRRNGRLEQALASLDSVAAEVEPERVAHIRAMILDRLRETDRAFAEFTRCNRLHAADASDPLSRARTAREQLQNDLDCLTLQWAAKCEQRTDPQAVINPVFLVGFPRSGTTLLDTLLMGHPKTVVLEEKPALRIVSDELGGIQALPSLGSTELARARMRYFEEVEASVTIGEGMTLIDKSPLYMQRVPMIRSLFPGARLIFAQRHPCDVLLSCFMSNFVLNPAMSNFLRLEDAAEYFDLTFQLWERSRELSTIDVHVVRYENLVEDTAGEVATVLAFLGLQPDEKALDHMRTARARGLITTASYAQVTEPIYTRAVDRWRSYRHHLDPILPVLAPWVEKLGYSL